jgi:cell division protein FtsL
MLRFVNICLVLGLAALATVIYQVKYQARSLDEKIVLLQRQIEEERDSLAVVRAEWSLLNRPERIERLAKKYLELNPAHPQQIVILHEVTESDFQRVRELALAAKAGDVKAATHKAAH